MSQTDSSDQEVSEWIRHSAGGPDSDVAQLMRHLQSRVRTEFCDATSTRPSENLIWSDLRGPARRIAEQQAGIAHLLNSAAIINGTLLDDPVPAQPRLNALLRYTGAQFLGRVGRAIVLLALRQVLPLLQGSWRTQTSINGLILAENHELLRRLTEVESTVRHQDERIAWLIGEVLKARNVTATSEAPAFKVVSDDGISRAA